MRFPLETHLEWFGGNEDVRVIFNCFAVLLHTWDDMVDKDVEVTPKDVNQAFMIALASLPSNSLYRAIQVDIIPMWEAFMIAYEAANSFEREHDDHGLEIGHNLRYAAGHIIAYALKVAVGYEKALELMPNLWKRFVPERILDYKKEHLSGCREDSNGI